MFILSAIGRFVGEFFLKKIWALAAALIARSIFKKKTEKESKESVQPLKDAKTGEAIDKSTDSALDGL